VGLALWGGGRFEGGKCCPSPDARVAGTSGGAPARPFRIVGPVNEIDVPRGLGSGISLRLALVSRKVGPGGQSVRPVEAGLKFSRSQIPPRPVSARRADHHVAALEHHAPSALFCGSLSGTMLCRFSMRTTVSHSRSTPQYRRNNIKI